VRAGAARSAIQVDSKAAVSMRYARRLPSIRGGDADTCGRHRHPPSHACSPCRSCRWWSCLPDHAALGSRCSDHHSGGSTEARLSGSRRAANARNRAYAIVHKPGVREPQSRMNRAIARPSSPIVVSVEQACHAGGRGFESRRSRIRSTCKSTSLVAWIDANAGSREPSFAAPRCS
jgi:hypothetical protein